MQAAVDAAGTQQALADKLGVTQQAVSLWLARGYAPTDRAREIEMYYGIPRVDMVDHRLLDALNSSNVL